jgi:hypothetical protein
VHSVRECMLVRAELFKPCSILGRDSVMWPDTPRHVALNMTVSRLMKVIVYCITIYDKWLMCVYTAHRDDDYDVGD